jgi:hypothetical protein
MPDEDPLWPDGIPPRFRRSARVPRLGSPPVETSTTFQVLPTALSLALALMLLIWYSALQRQGRVSADLDRLGALISGGPPPAGRSLVEGACLEVQRVEAEVAPVTAVLGAIGPMARGLIRAPVVWIDVQTGVSIGPWLDVTHVRDAANHLCAGARLAARAKASGGAADPADVDASHASFARALTALDSVPVGTAKGLGRVGAHVEAIHASIMTRRLDPASLVALSMASGPTVAGVGRGATYLLVARAHAMGGSPDEVAIARVTIRDGSITEYRVNTAAGWEARGNAVPAPSGLASARGDGAWRLADFDWWMDFRLDAAQLLALWQSSGQDSTHIDGIVAVDLAAFGDGEASAAASESVARRLDGILYDAGATRAGAGVLLSVLERAANAGLGVAWMREPVVQAVVEARGWGGMLLVPPADQLAVVRRTMRGPRSHVIEVVGPVSSGVRVDGVAPRVRLVLGASFPVRAVAGADGPPELSRLGFVTVLDVPVARGDGTHVVPLS